MKKLIISIALSSLIITSCSEWFDVDQKTQVSQEELFQQPSGFYNALFGIYLKVAENDLYGRTLSYELIEGMANSFAIDPGNTTIRYAQEYNFTSNEIEKKANSIWSKSYYSIANCNYLLKILPSKKKVFEPGMAEILEAESRTMRAFLHFDLLRLFAPAPIVGLDKKALPYVDSISIVPFKQLNTGEYLNKVINDLQIAKTLFENNENFLKTSESSDFIFSKINEGNFSVKSKYRFNKKAVYGLLARVNLYKGDYLEANKYAYQILKTDTIKVYIGQFPWQEEVYTGFYRNDVKENSKSILSNEASPSTLLYMDSVMRVKLFNPIIKYKPDPKKPGDSLISKVIFENRGSFWYDTPDKLMTDTAKIPNSYLNKYSFGTLAYPVFKLSEAYLIMAETAIALGNNGVDYLNEIRKSRNEIGLLPQNISSSNLEAEIYSEYSKEFIGEGQLFYYFKRKNFATFNPINGRVISGLTYKSYVLPIPDDEYEFGNIETN